MNLLEIVQDLHYEAGQPGSAPTTLATGSGRDADLVRWAIDSYNDIQRDHGGRWRWLRREFYVETVADDADYASSACTDTVAAALIDRFRAWHVNDEEDPPHIYLVSDGKATESRMYYYDWEVFRSRYILGTHTSAEPTVVSFDDADNLYLGPKPDAVYRVTGHYWRSNQVLADAADIPEMPVDFHKLIVYKAMTKYGYDVIAQHRLARAATDGTALYDALVDSQWFGAKRLRWPAALA